MAKLFRILLTFEQVPSVKAKSSRATSLETKKLNGDGIRLERAHLRSCVTMSEAKTKVY